MPFLIYQLRARLHCALAMVLALVDIAKNGFHTHSLVMSAKKFLQNSKKYFQRQCELPWNCIQLSINQICACPQTSIFVHQSQRGYEKTQIYLNYPNKFKLFLFASSRLVIDL